MKIEHIYPSDAGAERERKKKNQAAYTELQKMIYQAKMDNRAADESKKGKKDV